MVTSRSRGVKAIWAEIDRWLKANAPTALAGPFVSSHTSWGSWLGRLRDGMKAGEFCADVNGRIRSLIAGLDR